MKTPLDTSAVSSMLAKNKEQKHDPLFWKKSLDITFEQGKDILHNRIVPFHSKKSTGTENGVAVISPRLVVISSKTPYDDGVFEATVKFKSPESDDARKFVHVIRNMEIAMKADLVDKFEQHPKYVDAAYHSFFEVSDALHGNVVFEISIPETVTGIIYSAKYSNKISFKRLPPGFEFNLMLEILGPQISTRRKSPNPFIRLAPKFVVDSVFFDSKDSLDAILVSDEVIEAEPDFPEIRIKKKAEEIKYRDMTGTEYSVHTDITKFLKYESDSEYSS